MSNFRTLQAKWYRKLKKEGFEDIEDTSSSQEMLKKWDSSFYRLYDKNTFAENQRYYELARQFLNDHVFDTSLEKEIWAMHSEGVSARDIIKLKDSEIRKRLKTKLRRIGRVIKQLEDRVIKGSIICPLKALKRHLSDLGDAQTKTFIYEVISKLERLMLA